MECKTISSEEGNVLLRQLLDKEQLERKDIATRLHGKKSDLMLIKFALYQMEKDASEGKFDPSNVAEINNLLDNYIEDTRSVEAEIFNPIIKLSGLVLGLKTLGGHGRRKSLNIVTVVTEWQEEAKKTDLLLQFGVYRVCYDAVAYFELNGFTECKIILSINTNCLHVELNGMVPSDLKGTANELREQANILKATIFWRGAKVLKETNWLDKFKFEFDYQINNNLPQNLA